MSSLPHEEALSTTEDTEHTEVKMFTGCDLSSVSSASSVVES